MAPPPVALLYVLLQFMLLHAFVCLVHLRWGLAFSKWLRTRKCNDRHDGRAFAVLALATVVSTSSLIYLVKERLWTTCGVAVLAFIVGNRLCVWGLTGSIASGKTTVSAWLEDALDVAVIDADKIAHQVLEFPHKAFASVVEEFGTGILCQNASVPRIDRRALRELVFHDPRKRELLNRITHPYILREMVWQVFKYRVLQWRSKVLLDAALLFETHLHWLCAPVIVVAVDERTQLSRLRKRDGEKCDSKTLERMVHAQMRQSEKCQEADIVIDNNGTLEELYDHLASRFLKHSGRQL